MITFRLLPFWFILVTIGNKADRDKVRNLAAGTHHLTKYPRKGITRKRKKKQEALFDNTDKA